MPNLKTTLKNRLTHAESIAVLGVGSELRGDDIAGTMAAEELQKILKEKKESQKIKIFFGATAPENLTGEIKRFAPSHIIVIDTVEMEEEPGTILVLQPDNLGGGVSFSTHMMPSKVMIEYFQKSFKCEVIIIGVQPASVKFGKSISKHVKESVRDIAKSIHAALPKTLTGAQ